MELNAIQLISFEIIIAVVGLYLGIKCLFLKKDNMDYFRRFIIVLDLFLFVNIPIRLVELHITRFEKNLTYCLYDASIILMTYLMVTWFLFLLKQIDSVFVKTKYRTFLCLIPSFFIIPLCILNRWNGWLYYINADGWYNRGSIFILQSLTAYPYFIFVMIVIGVDLFTAKNNRPVVKKCFVTTIPVFLSGILQTIFGGSVLLGGATVGALIMYVEICLDRQKAYEINEQVSSMNSALALSQKTIASNMKTILALSEIYQIILDINVQNDSLTVIKAPDNVLKICRKYTSAGKCLRALPDVLFALDSVNAMKELYDPDILFDWFMSKKSYSSDAISKKDRRWNRSCFIVSEFDAAGKPEHIIMTLQDVTDEKERQKKFEDAAFYQKSAKEMEELFTQTAEALASAIDAKDEYTHGHSVRVAEYSREIAELAGLSEQDCKEVYYSGLLHDVGKIGIPDEIIHKNSKLTEEEFAQIKRHPVMGKDILQSISKLPYLSVGAHYHHERFDGRGYPDGLKATDIPELARIISVADAYDAMTSKRSYRDPIPQQKVREEILKGLGSQFDPKYGRLMIQMIDADKNYEMKEHRENSGITGNTDLVCEENRKNYSEGIKIDSHKIQIKVHCTKHNGKDSYPFLIFFDSLDARVHENERDIKDLLYTEYCELFFDGKSNASEVRKIQTEKEEVSKSYELPESYDFTVEAVRVKDHLSVVMSDGKYVLNTTIALQDSTRYTYIALTGKDVTLSNVSLERDEEVYPADKIHRIAEEISYIDMPEGDIPNVQVDSWMTAHTKGLRIGNYLQMNMHVKSLPFARLVWHCPFILIYTSDNGEVDGNNYREFSLIRLDGESWSSDKASKNDLMVTKTEDFVSWRSWKADNKAGRDVVLRVSRDGNVISVSTDCGGIKIKNTTTLMEEVEHVYISVTGDQCVLENIKIS